MTIDEAIKELESQECNYRYHSKEPAYRAIMLGIEALTLYRDMKLSKEFTILFKLPGETEE